MPDWKQEILQRLAPLKLTAGARRRSRRKSRSTSKIGMASCWLRARRPQKREGWL